MDPINKPIVTGAGAGAGVAPGRSDVDRPASGQLKASSGMRESGLGSTGQQADVIAGQWRAIPGGFTSASTAVPPVSTSMGPAGVSADEMSFPSRFTGGIGPEAMLGKWKLVRSENFDDYLKALGVNIIKRNIMPLEEYCAHFERIGEETYKMTISTTMKKIELTFKLDDQEVEEYTDDGRKVLTKFKWDNGVLTQRRFAQEEGEKGGVVIRVFKGDNMELIAKVDDVICKRFYKRDESCM